MIPRLLLLLAVALGLRWLEHHPVTVSALLLVGVAAWAVFATAVALLLIANHGTIPFIRERRTAP